MLNERRLNLSRDLSQEKRKLQMLDDSAKVAILSFIEKVKGESKCTEEQEQYFQNLKVFLNPKGNKSCSIEQIMNLEIHQLLVRVLLEYVFLRDKNFENWWYEYEYFEDIYVSNRYVENVRRRIIATYDEFGAEAIVNRFAEAEKEQYRSCLEDALESVYGMVLTEDKWQEFLETNAESINYFIKGHFSIDSNLTREEFFDSLMTLSGGKYSLKKVEAYVIE